jgi:hypothetical protein
MPLALAVIVTCVVTACGAGQATESASVTPAAGPARPYPQTDQEIAGLIYSDSDRTPSGFYAELAEPPPAGVTEVITLHLKSAHPQGYELCTDDWSQALEWSEQITARMSAYADLVATNAVPRFFEFVRVPRRNPTALLRHRVFRCAYLDRITANSSIRTR